VQGRSQSGSSLAETDMSEAGDASRRVKLLGVCGGIGSGKSHVCKTLVSEFGCLARIGMYACMRACMVEVGCLSMCYML
jgi:putative protein kinase ArgK-like GTPase of G3E family